MQEYPAPHSPVPKYDDNFFREIVEQAKSIIVKLDPQGTITYINAHGLLFFGYTYDELVGRNAVGTIIPFIDESGHDLRAMMMDMLAHPDRYSANENENMRKDGSRVLVNWMNTRIADETGATREILCVGADATARTHVEAALEEERHFLRELSDAIPNPLYYKDLDGHFLMWNKAFEQLTGFPAEELPGKTVFDIFPPDVAALCNEKDRQILRDGNIRTCEAVIPSIDGGERVVVFTKAPHTDRDGTVIGFVGVVTDITAQKKAEMASAEQEEAMNIVLRSLPAGILLIDAATHRIVGANDTAIALFGLPEEEVIGEHCTRFICHSAGFDCPTSESDGIINEECMLTTGGGKPELPILKSAAAVRIRGRDMILESFVDLTGEKKAETERLQHERLKTALELAGAASHELNQPLQIISGYAGVLRYQVPEVSEMAKKSVDEILAQVRRMADILWKLTHLTTYRTREYAGSDQIMDIEKSSNGAPDMIAPGNRRETPMGM